MKYLDEYRDANSARKLIDAIRRIVTRPWTIMEVCGGQTHTIVKYGLDRILPESVELVHGPGCPVCVTSLETIDKAHAIIFGLARTLPPPADRTSRLAVIAPLNQCLIKVLLRRTSFDHRATAR